MFEVILGLLQLMHVSQTLSCHDPNFGDVHFVKLEDGSDDVVAVFPHLLRHIKFSNLLVQIRKVFDTASPEVLELSLSQRYVSAIVSFYFFKY